MNIKEIIAIEEQIRSAIAQLTEEIRTSIRNNPMSGITPLGNICFLVKLSTLENNRFNLSPEYYSPDTQADTVGNYLKGSKTATEFISRIDRLIAEKKLKEGCNTTFFNEKTIEILIKYKEGVEAKK